MKKTPPDVTPNRSPDRTGSPPGKEGARNPKEAQSGSSENLGQEGAQSTIKRNTTDGGKRQDRGP